MSKIGSIFVLLLFVFQFFTFSQIFVNFSFQHADTHRNTSSLGSNYDFASRTPMQLKLNQFINGYSFNYSYIEEPLFVTNPEFFSGQIYGGNGAYATYSTDIAVDHQGNFVIVGRTPATDFPVYHAFQDSLKNASDAFVSKFSPAGTLLWSTYLGGLSSDIAISVATDSLDNVIVTGFTSSIDFPVLDSNSTYTNNTDIFLTKFSSSGMLLFSRYFGGNGFDFTRDVFIDVFDNIYITGGTESTDFPIFNAVNISNGNGGAFISKFSPSGQLLFSTHFGPDSDGWAIAVDSLGAMLITGWSSFGTIPLMNGFNITTGHTFISKLSSTGNLIFSTYIPGSDYQESHGIGVDSSGNFYVSGYTESNDFITLNSYSNYSLDTSNIFLMKFSSTGDLLFSSLLGGTYNGYPNSNGFSYSYDLNVDSDGNCYLVGTTEASNFPIFHDFGLGKKSLSQVPINKSSTYLFESKFSSTGDLLFSTILNYNVTNNFAKSAIDANGNSYIIENKYVQKNNNFSYLTSFTGIRDLADSDGDNIPNYYETLMGLNKTSNDAQLDKDLDGLTNLQEFSFNSWANKSDSDSDGMNDLDEFNNKLNPIYNDANLDKDFDLVSNYNEYLAGTSANDIFSFPLASFNIWYLIISITVIIAIILQVKPKYKDIIKNKYHQMINTRNGSKIKNLSSNNLKKCRFCGENQIQDSIFCSNCGKTL